MPGNGGPVLIGPKQPTAGVVMAYTVPADTASIYVQNYTRLHLLISFGDVAPTATDSLSNQYDGVLAPGGRDLFYVQSRGASSRERGLNAMGAFTGHVWIMPVDRSNTLAFAGTASGNNDIWVSAYGPYDPPPPFPGGMPLNVDISSQPRVISLPIPGDFAATDTWSPAVTNPFSLIILQIPPALVTAGQFIFYIFHLSAFPQLNAAATSQTVAFQAQLLDNSLANIGAATLLYEATIAAAGSGTNAGFYSPLIIQPHFPLAYNLQPPANAVWVAFQTRLAAGGTTPIVINFAAMLDFNNTGIPPNYGGTNSGNIAERWAGQFGGLGGTGMW